MLDKPTVLVVDDDHEMTSVLCDILGDAGYRALSADSAAKALALVREHEPDLLISDLRMSGMGGHELQNEVKKLAPRLPVIMITAFGSISTAVESMKLGAFDYLTKPFANDEFLLVVSRALENRELRREVTRLRGELARSYGVANIIAVNPRFVAALDRIKQVADSQVSVLIAGESGTGKELLARALHFASTRRDFPFVPINCAAIPDNLIESEMFGYVKGAFTDARSAKMGLFQAARGGTLFLDEIGDMPLGLQSKLLRVIEDKRIRPLGATEEIALDVRIVAATNVDLEQSIEQGKFRSDLFYRLTTFTISVPPLRDRAEDLPLLVQHFLARAAAESGKPVPVFDSAAMECLVRYGWPGNVRELQNVVQSAVILCHENRITLADLPPRIVGRPGSETKFTSDAVARRLTLDELEREYIRLVLASVSGNKTEAAGILQIDRKTLNRKLD